jgi:hypothetical protein
MNTYLIRNSNSNSGYSKNLLSENHTCGAITHNYECHRDGKESKISKYLGKTLHLDNQ